MDFEFHDDGYLAKIVVEHGGKDIPVGCQLEGVENDADVGAFERFSVEGVDEGDSDSASGIF